MARTDTCDVCGRSVTITTDRGEYVARGLQGYEFSDGSIRCEGNMHGPEGKCMTNQDGEAVFVGDRP